MMDGAGSASPVGDELGHHFYWFNAETKKLEPLGVPSGRKAPDWNAEMTQRQALRNTTAYQALTNLSARLAGLSHELGLIRSTAAPDEISTVLCKLDAVRGELAAVKGEPSAAEVMETLRRVFTEDQTSSLFDLPPRDDLPLTGPPMTAPTSVEDLPSWHISCHTAKLAPSHWDT